MPYQRVPTLLTPEQYRRLKRLAQHRSESLSSVVRELVEQGLANLPLAELPEEADLAWLDRTEQTVQRMFAARGGETHPRRCRRTYPRQSGGTCQ